MVAKKRKPVNKYATMDAVIAFEAGKNDYRIFKQRPPTPTEEAADDPESFRFYGWMIARANEVQKIILDIKTLDLSEKKGDALLKKRVAGLDCAHDQNGRAPKSFWDRA